MRKPKLRELSEALRAIFSRPYTTKFPALQPELPEGFRGKPEFQKECIACSACAQVCPSKAIEMIDDLERKTRSILLHLDQCIFCGLCVENCPVKTGIIQSKTWDLACFDRSQLLEKIERNLVVCEICGEIISTKDHILWVANQLGALAYANPTLLLMSLSDGNLLEPLKFPVVKEDLTRLDRISITCPRCRHLTSLLG